MKPFSKRLNHFIDIWFAQNSEKFTVYKESQFNFEDTDETFKLFTEHYKKYNTIPLWYDDNEDNIFGDTLINAKFRAWHDYCHILLSCNFSLEGEIEVYTFQQAMLPDDWEYEKQLMYCEIVGQAEHYSSGGEKIKDQRTFTDNFLKK